MDNPYSGFRFRRGFPHDRRDFDGVDSDFDLFVYDNRDGKTRLCFSLSASKQENLLRQWYLNIMIKSGITNIEPPRSDLFDLSSTIHTFGSEPPRLPIRFGAPFTTKASLAFCCYNGSVCCSSKDDQQLQKQFKAMNPSDTGCASVFKSILCAEIY